MVQKQFKAKIQTLDTVLGPFDTGTEIEVSKRYKITLITKIEIV